MIDQAVKEQIRARVDIVELVGSYVKLQKAGRVYKGLCPFHGEKTPSFQVTPEIKRYYCFGCKENGDIFDFLKKIENLDFVEALKKLAEKAGVELKESMVSIQKPAQKEAWYDILNTAQLFFKQQLKLTAEANEYLVQRGISAKTIEKYGIGFAPDSWDSLSLHLVKIKANIHSAQKMGLVDIGREGSYYDKFRSRIMFPIKDAQGRIIAFGGRALGDGTPKYLNSQETPLFSKRNTLYGLFTARASLLKNRTAVLVEGYFDVILAQTNGIENCVATLGTSLTEDHVKNLHRWADKVVIAYDGDSSGITAAIKAAQTLENDGIDVRIAALPIGEDPDSYIRSKGPAELIEKIYSAETRVSFELAKIIAKNDKSSQNGRLQILKEGIDLISSVSSAVERDIYVRRIAPFSPMYKNDALRAEEAIRDDITQSQRNAIRGGRKGVNQLHNQPAQETKLSAAAQHISPALLQSERSLLRASCDLEWRESLWDWIRPDLMEIPEHISTADKLREVWGDTAPDVSADILINHLEDGDSKKVLTDIMVNDKITLTKRFLDDCINYLLKLRKRRELALLRDKLGAADAVNEQRMFERLIAEANGLHKDH